MDPHLVLAELEKALDYVDRVAPRARWGKSDCLTVPAGIVKRAGGPDFAAPYVGRYRNEKDLAALLPRGLAVECRRQARAFGWRAVQPPEAEPGAWGVCRNLQGVQFNVIKYKGDYWLGTTDRGVTYIKSDQVRVAWQSC